MVLCGYSALVCGRGMRGIEQQKKLHTFYKAPNHLSNINMHLKGLGSYSDLYKEVVYEDILDDDKRTNMNVIQHKAKT